ncbi:MAG: 4Fe-4S binding protein [Thermoplasmata archaeon]|nr:4Fe-4S binding protein [Thermoplasmata archaeon]
MQKWVEVDYNLCNPQECDSAEGRCIASRTCKYSILEQEAPYEVPMHLSREQCKGCEDCTKSCPLNAIRQSTGV